MIEDKNIDAIVLRGLIFWSMLEKEKGYKQFWRAYKINGKEHIQVGLFISLITPRVQEFYKEAKYDLIENNIDKCTLKVNKGLEMHPYHT